MAIVYSFFFLFISFFSFISFVFFTDHAFEIMLGGADSKIPERMSCDELNTKIENLKEGSAKHKLYNFVSNFLPKVFQKIATGTTIQDDKNDQPVEVNIANFLARTGKENDMLPKMTTARHCTVCKDVLGEVVVDSKHIIFFLFYCMIVPGSNLACLRVCCVCFVEY